MDDPAVPVSVQGFTWSAAAGWAQFALVLGVIGTIIKALGPTRMVELLFNRSRELRAEKQVEEANNAQRISALDERVSRLSGSLAFMANALTVAMNGLSVEDPATRRQATMQARELVAMAVSTLGKDDPFTKALDRLAVVPGVGESAEGVIG